MNIRFRSVVRVVAALLLITAAAHSQSLPPVEKLPADTQFFVLWRGAGALNQAKATNAVLRAWNDVEFNPVRTYLMDRLRSGLTSPGETRAEAEMSVEVFSGPALLGFNALPQLSATTPETKPGETPAPASKGMFAIIDVTGKTDLVRKLDELSSARKKAEVSNYEFAGHSIRVAIAEKDTSYSTLVGNQYFASDNKATLEDILQRFTSKAPPPDSITSARGYATARQFAGSDAVLEIFFRVPDLTKLNIPPQRDFDVAAMLRELHLERVHSVAASLNFAGESTRFRTALIGDTTPGSAFDLAAESSPTFSTLHAAPPRSSYNSFRMNLSALYSLLRAALQAGLPPQQANSLEMMEGMLAMQIGMPLTQALSAVTGEIAAISDEKSMPTASDPLASLFAVGLRNSGDALKLLRIALGTRITSEDVEGDVTYLAIATPYIDPKTQAQRTRFHHVAVTPQMLLAAPRKAQVREAVARVAAGGAAGATATLASDAQFARARAKMPATLTGLQYSDLSQVNWTQLVESLLTEAQKDPKTAETAQDNAALLKTAATVAGRYLKLTAAGWWKDRNGLFMESHIE